VRQYGRADVDYSTWYTPWMKQLARTYSRDQLELRLGKNRAEAPKAGESHLRAIGASSSMRGQSMRRAHARNIVTAVGDEAIALRGAIEIHELFPEEALQ